MPADKDSLKKILSGGKPEPDLPLANEDIEQNDVGPCGMVSVKGCHALDIERAGEPVPTLRYMHLAVKGEFSPGKFWVIFDDHKERWKLTVEGRNLRPIYDRLNDLCLRRIRVAHRGDMLPDDGKPVVTRITVEEVKEKE